MIKVKAPDNHNWTHLKHPRTLWEAFQGKGEQFISETPTTSSHDLETIYLFVLQWVAVILFSFALFYLVAYL